MYEIIRQLKLDPTST